MADSEFTHLNEQGRARMVDVSDKEVTKRVATARTTLTMSHTTLHLIKQGRMNKGDVLAIAQVAGVMAAKKTSEWIPLCHPIPLTGINIVFDDNDSNELYIEATVRTTGVTGVEMEALTAVSAAALTVYDMCKAVEKEIMIGPTMLIMKTGGKSGSYHKIDTISSS